LFHDKQHPSTLGEVEVAQFLSFLANEGQVAAATQNLALNALVFLYKVVLERPLAEIAGVVRAKKPQRLPVVLNRSEVAALLKQLEGEYGPRAGQARNLHCGNNTLDRNSLLNAAL
jgi:integrase